MVSYGMAAVWIAPAARPCATPRPSRVPRSASPPTAGPGAAPARSARAPRAAARRSKALFTFCGRKIWPLCRHDPAARGQGLAGLAPLGEGRGGACASDKESGPKTSVRAVIHPIMAGHELGRRGRPSAMSLQLNISPEPRLASPSLCETLSEEAKRGAKKLVGVPFFLGLGRGGVGWAQL